MMPWVADPSAGAVCVQRSAARCGASSRFASMWPPRSAKIEGRCFGGGENDSLFVDESLLSSPIPPDDPEFPGCCGGVDADASATPRSDDTFFFEFARDLGVAVDASSSLGGGGGAPRSRAR